MVHNMLSALPSWRCLGTCFLLLTVELILVSGLPTSNNIVTSGRHGHSRGSDTYRPTREEGKYMKRRRKLKKRWRFDVDVSTNIHYMMDCICYTRFDYLDNVCNEIRIYLVCRFDWFVTCKSGWFVGWLLY